MTTPIPDGPCGIRLDHCCGCAVGRAARLCRGADEEELMPGPSRHDRMMAEDDEIGKSRFVSVLRFRNWGGVYGGYGGRGHPSAVPWKQQNYSSAIFLTRFTLAHARSPWRRTGHFVFRFQHLRAKSLADEMFCPVIHPDQARSQSLRNIFDRPLPAGTGARNSSVPSWIQNEVHLHD